MQSCLGLHARPDENEIAPSGLVGIRLLSPTASAVGCILSPLRGCSGLRFPAFRFACGYQEPKRNSETYHTTLGQN
jgi:hypothetical protein